MLRKPQYSSLANSIEKNNHTSSYGQNSPAKRQRKPSLVIAEQLRNGTGFNQLPSNQDFSKRLEEIKRKYTSPTRTKTISNPMTPIDLSKRSTIVNQNNSKIREQVLLNKNALITRASNQSRIPLNDHIPSNYFNVTMPSSKSQLSSPLKKGALDQQRINSIDTINQKIKSILEGINYKNDRFNENIKTTQPDLQRPGHSNILSARPEQKRHIHTAHVSLQKGTSSSMMKKSYLDSFEKDKRSSNTKQFDMKMFEIQQKIKTSEQNRMKIMENYQNKQSFNNIVPSTHLILQKKTQSIIQTKPELQVKQKVPSTAGQYSHRYIDFGKNMSRNILDELKSFNKKQTTIQSTQIEPTQITKNQTKKLINAFIEQVKLDQQLRNAKLWLQTNQDLDKWTKLKEIMSRRQAKSHTQQSIQSIFKCSQDDHNPFFVNQQNESLQTLASKYLNSELFWNKKFTKQFNLKRLEQQGFKSEILDLELKGYLQIEDIVRYLNIETGKFYRNRDLVFLFKRITKSNRLSFSELLNVIGA